jgi:Tfp pilus assembly protein PilP
MIQDPSGKGFTVRVGNYLGTQEGRIVRIALNAVELVESVPTIKDRDATRTTILRLHDQEEME